MTSTISEDALQGQQSRIMNALKAQAAPSQMQISPQDLLQATLAGNKPGGDYFTALKQAQTTQAQNDLTAQTGIYNQMKEQVARGNSNAAIIDKTITDIAGDDPKIYASIAEDLHNDPENITSANAKSKVMKYAADRGINPLSNQQEEAKTSKALADSRQSNAFNPINPSPPLNTTKLENSSTNNNEDYLSTLPQNTAAQVKAIAEGRMPFPGGMALKTPYWQGMLNAVSQYDPTFDAVNYNARAQTRKDFTSGKGAQNITALNTAMGHLDSLDKAFSGLKNSDYPIYNSIANSIARNAGNKNIQTALKDVNSKTTAVADELAKVFRSSGMSEKDIQAWKEQFNSNNSPTENKAAIKSSIELMKSRLDAIGQQYNQGMGTTKDSIQLLSPKAQLAYERLTGSNEKATEPLSEQSPDIQNQVARDGRNSDKIIDYTEYFK